MPTTAVERFAAVVLGGESLVLLVLAGWELVALVSGDTESISSSIALLVLTALGAVAVGAFAVAVWRGASWGRSGGIVTQLLTLAVALGALTGADPQPGFAAAIAAPAVVALVALILSARAAGQRVRGSD
jgi:hypothetical protein